MKHKQFVILGVVAVCVIGVTVLAWFVTSRGGGEALTAPTAQLQSAGTRAYVEAADEYEVGSVDWTDIMLNAAIDAAEKGKCSDARNIYATVGQHMRADTKQAYDDLKTRIQACAS